MADLIHPSALAPPNFIFTDAEKFPTASQCFSGHPRIWPGQALMPGPLGRVEVSTPLGVERCITGLSKFPWPSLILPQSKEKSNFEEVML
jgi:hypothetical protein